MSDILYDAAKNYSSLLDKGYHIVLGRKGRIYEINLRFDMEDFFDSRDVFKSDLVVFWRAE